MEASCTKVYLVHGKDLNSSNSYYKQRLDVTAASRKLSKMTGCLEIIEGEDDGQSKICQDSASYDRPSSNAGDRPWSRGSIGYFPPRTDSSMSRRLNTPTKQISLQAVRRKEESTEPFVDQVDWQPITLENNRKIWKPETNTGYPEPTQKHVQADGFWLETVAETSWQLTEQLVSEPKKVTSKVTSQTETICDSGIVEAAQERGVSNEEKNREEKNTDDSDEGDDDDDDDDDSDSSQEEEEKLRAPNELLMEFVDCLMRKDFQTASKLCKMILLYEPENPEALKFQPLIEEKLVLDAEAEKEAAEESGDDDDDDSDDESEDEDDGNDASEDEDEDSSSDADSSEEDDDGSDDDDCDGGSTGSGSNNNNNNNGIQGSCRQRHLK